MFEHYHEYENLLASLQVVLVMMGMGATLSPGDCLKVAREPRSLLLGIACQFALAPALAMLTISLVTLPPGIAVGLVLIAAMPGGPLANLFTFLAKGNLALSIAMTAVATVGSVVTAPLLLSTLAIGITPGQFEVPVAWVVRDIGLYLFAPLAVGMAVLRFAPRASKTFSTLCVRAGLLILLAIIVGSLGGGRIRPLEHGWSTPIALIVLCVAIQNLSMLLFGVLKLPIPDQTAVGVGVTIRNINLALLLKTKLFPAEVASAGGSLGDDVLYVILFWGALSLIVCTPTIFVQPRLMQRQAERERTASESSL